MDQITLNIPDKKVSLFIQMIGDLDFVKIKECKKVSLEVELTPGQKRLGKILKEVLKK